MQIKFLYKMHCNDETIQVDYVLSLCIRNCMADIVIALIFFVVTTSLPAKHIYLGVHAYA